MTAQPRAATKRNDAADENDDPFQAVAARLPITDTSVQRPTASQRLETKQDARRRRDLFLALFWPRSVAVAFTVVTKGIVAIVYEALLSQGLRHILPDMGMRLYRIPGLAFLELYTATYRLDLAHLFAAVPLVCTFVAWKLLLEMYLRREVFAHRFRRWDLDRLKRVIVTMGTIIVTGDAALFCLAVSIASWGQARLSAAAVLATAVYMTVLGFVTWVSLWLNDRVEEAKINFIESKTKTKTEET
jgi:hypothetical protein